MLTPQKPLRSQRVTGSIKRSLGVVLALTALSPTISRADPTELAKTGQPVQESFKKICLRVAGAQIPVTRDIRRNVETLTRAIEYAQREKADVLVTPEGALSGYWTGFDAEATNQALEGIVARAKAANIALVLGTCFADENGTPFDAQRFYDRTGTYLGFHSKILLCRSMSKPGAAGEADYFKSAPLRVFRLHGLTVGGLVCNDMWANPECTPMPDPYLARQLAGMGAKVVFHSVNAGQDDGENWPLFHAFHESNLRLRARSSKLWFIVVDAADPDGKKRSNCPSGVVGPDGHWAVQVKPEGEQFFAHTIEVERP